jgi:DNA-binding CsgD family transcriptional regulator
MYALVLQMAEEMEPQVHAALLEAYASESNLTENQTEAIASLQRAAEIWGQLNKPLEQGKALATMAIILRNSGKNPEAEQVNRASIAMLEKLPPSRALALAYRVQGILSLSQRAIAEAIHWSERAIELADKFGDENVRIMSQTALGSAWLFTDFERGRQILEQCLETAKNHGQVTHCANIYTYIGSCSTELYQFHYAETKLSEGVAYTNERDLDIFTHLMQTWQALTQIRLGQWQKALQTIRQITSGLSYSTISRIPTLAATGLLQARSGAASPAAALEEALQLAERTGTLQHLGLVRAVRAEAAWLSGDPQQTRDEARAAYSLALNKQHAWLAGELAYWRWQGGDEIAVQDWMARPFALQISGDWKSAAREWERLGCPYEQARALEEGDAEAKVAALQIYEQLGAFPAARLLREKLKAEGAVRLPRQARQSTRHNPFGLTTRQVEILALLVEGLSNTEIAGRLHISLKTADHHVAAVLRSLGVNSRQAAAGLARQHPHFTKK